MTDETKESVSTQASSEIVGEILMDELSGLLPTALLELDEAQEIIQGGILQAMATGDLRVVDELEAQLSGLAALNLIRLKRATLRTGLRVVTAGVRVGLHSLL